MANRPRLGLALSGGGFRASFFHLGVLRRLAELDLLRHLSVLSTVSGGSVVGALYMIHLARRLGREATIARHDYVALVGEVEREFRAGTAKDLRNRLLLDPLQNLRMLCLGFPLGRRMARLYQKHLYADAARQADADWGRGIPLDGFRIRPGGQPLGVEIERYNAGETDRLPKWVINATCLNTGRVFRFSPSELGDPVLGSLRFDERDTVLAYKRLALSAWVGAAKLVASLREKELARTTEFRGRTARHLAWWLAVQDGLRVEQDRPNEPGSGEAAYRARLAALRSALPQAGAWLDVLLDDDWDAARRLATADFRLLRRAKMAAWYLRDGAALQPPVTGGVGEEMHVRRLWSAVADVDVPMAERLQAGAPSATNGVPELAELALDLFYFRSAEAFAWTAKRATARLTVADAVAASANFPPVFAPLVVPDLFEPHRTWRLSLTDGGVYDNIGLDALMDEECTHVIASDAGERFTVESAPAASRLGSLGRMADLLMATDRDRQLSALRETRRVSEAAAEATFCKGPRMSDVRARYHLDALVMFHIASSPGDGAPDGLPPHPLAADIARLRTDLDAFHPDEIEALMYQGYQLGDRFVRRYIGTVFPLDISASKAVPLRVPAGARLARVGRIIRAGRYRVLRLLFQQPRLAQLLAAMLVLGLVALWLYVPFAVSTAAGRVAALISRFARWPLLVGGRQLWLEHPRSGWVLLGGLAALCWAYVRWPRLEMAVSRGLSRFAPRVVQIGVASLMQLAGLWRRNILWLLGYAPAVLSVFGSVVAGWCWITGRITRRG